MNNLATSTQPPAAFRNRPGQAGSGVFPEATWQVLASSLRLSGRELQILRGVFNDETEYAMATNLHVSPHTIHTYSERLHRKLHVTGRVKLVLRVMDEFHSLTVAPGTVLPSICAKRAAGRCPLRHV